MSSLSRMFSCAQVYQRTVAPNTPCSTTARTDDWSIVCESPDSGKGKLNPNLVDSLLWSSPRSKQRFSHFLLKSASTH
ncbi:unnamed protein product [Clavelina lepadiformis]|uniref:Uncharacterized protein n=1 Tax=Clavelina lepadiformis TaxID=159417 RepID=A0ABP0G7N0_CLALP